MAAKWRAFTQQYPELADTAIHLSTVYTFCIRSVITCRRLSQHALQLLLYHAFVLAEHALRSVYIEYTHEYFSYSVLISAIIQLLNIILEIVP